MISSPTTYSFDFQACLSISNPCLTVASLDPLAFTADGGAVYLIDSRNVNAGRLVKFDLETRELEVIAEDPNYDVEDVILNPDTWAVEAVSFYAAREEWKSATGTAGHRGERTTSGSPGLAWNHPVMLR